MEKVCYKNEWANIEFEKYKKKLDEVFKSQKDRIIVDSLKDFDRSIKKQIESMVSTAFYDKEIICNKFWDHINTCSKEI